MDEVFAILWTDMALCLRGMRGSALIFDNARGIGV